MDCRPPRLTTLRTIGALTALAGALAVASPASAAPSGDCVDRASCVAGEVLRVAAAEGDPLTGGEPERDPNGRDDERRVEPAEGDPLPGGDPERDPNGRDEERRVEPAEGDPPPGGEPERDPNGRDDERRVEPAEGDPLPGGDPERAVDSKEETVVRMTAVNDRPAVKRISLR
jgi:hypothetical protein